MADGLGDGWAADVYDRRGRGNSTEQPADYSMATEIADVRTVMDATAPATYWAIAWADRWR
ncbi:hypothetical protein NFC73_07865 [Pseudarthrobacter sp. RMG13]|uniref:Uncharacterized protein n=1 Tax=Pseudarthrobacter humi TaxID=2952523 RepID=A0ABT1LMG7_9MICC|nr:hypothetical protein [Pseudarthrobacter humi]MCP8999647.1 hypothetical protein [Pseudarthrobacter humi]